MDFFIGNRSGSIGFPEDVSEKQGWPRGGRKRHETSTGGGAGRATVDALAGGFRLRWFSSTIDRDCALAAVGQRSIPGSARTCLVVAGGEFGTRNGRPGCSRAAQKRTSLFAHDVAANQSSVSPWPETQSEWMARNFPRFNRLWNGSPREAGDAQVQVEVSASRRPSKPPDDDTSVTASEDIVPSTTDGARASRSSRTTRPRRSKNRSTRSQPIQQRKQRRPSRSR